MDGTHIRTHIPTVQKPRAKRFLTRVARAGQGGTHRPVPAPQRSVELLLDELLQAGREEPTGLRERLRVPSAAPKTTKMPRTSERLQQQVLPLLPTVRTMESEFVRNLEQMIADGKAVYRCKQLLKLVKVSDKYYWYGSARTWGMHQILSQNRAC